MTALVVAAALLAGAGDRAAQDRFASEVLAELKARLPKLVVRYDPDAFTLSIDGAPATVGLTNVYGTWKAAPTPAARSASLQALVSSVAVATGRIEDIVPARFEDAAIGLVPRVRDLASAEIFALSLQGKSKPVELIEKRLGTHLHAVVVYDFGSGLADVPASMLEKWKRTPDEVLRVAVNNLRAVPPNFAQVSPGVYVAADGDDLEASRLLLEPEVLALKVTGAPVAFAVHRRFLLITGDADAKGLALAAERVSAEVPKPYPVSVVPLRYVNGRWSTWRVPAATPAGKTFDALRLQEEQDIAADKASVKARAPK